MPLIPNGWIGLMPGPMRSGRDWRIVDRAESGPPAACLQADMPDDLAERLDTWGAFWFSPLDVLGFTAVASLALVVVVQGAGALGE